MPRLRTIVLVIAALGVGAFGYWAISPLFRTVKANDALPGARQGMAEKGEGGAMETGGAAGAPEEGAVMPGGEGEAAAMYDTPPAEVFGTAGHPASGAARIVSADGKQYVRYENFKTINGPDIYVYLAKDKDAREFVDLGPVKATEGNVNYEIPSGVDPAEYPYVLTWCKAFGVLFNYAQLRS